MSVAEKLTAIAENMPKVYEAGEQSAYDRFWDVYQQSGERYNYYQLFAQSGWNDDTFKPKYPITCSGTQSYHSTNAASIFNNSYVTVVPVPVVVTGLPLTQTFYNATKLETISLLVLNGVTAFTQTFSYCSKLRNIAIDGSIDADISFSGSPLLTDASVQSIIDHLKDLSGGTTQTLKFHADVGAKLTDAQKAAIAAKNWTLVY